MTITNSPRLNARRASWLPKDASSLQTDGNSWFSKPPWKTTTLRGNLRFLTRAWTREDRQRMCSDNIKLLFLVNKRTAARHAKHTRMKALNTTSTLPHKSPPAWIQFWAMFDSFEPQSKCSVFLGNEEVTTQIAPSQQLFAIHANLLCKWPFSTTYPDAK